MNPGPGYPAAQHTAEPLRAKVLAQLLLMQNVLCNLPDERTIMSFVCRGLADIPGLDEARLAESGTLETATWLRHPIPLGGGPHVDLRLNISDPAAFAPYEPYLRNFLSMVAIILDGRRQQRVIAEHSSQLEQRVALRTHQLTDEIGERLKIEDDLQRNRNMLAHTLDAIPQAVFWKNRDGVYLGCNAVFARAAGLDSPEEIVGKTDLDLPWPRGEAEAYRSDDRAVIDAGQSKRHIIEPLQQADGSRLWIDTSKVPLRDKSGEIYGVLGVFDDITERRLAEEEKARMQAQLTQAQKMESVGRLAGGVAHDFNNMLQAIIGYTGLALEQASGNPDVTEPLDEVLKAARRSTELTHQLLAFARKQTIQPRVLDLNETVSSMLKMLHRLIGENIRIDWQPAAHLWPVRIDPVQIDQLLANLTVNARDAIGGTGTITIATGNRTVGPGSEPGLAPGDYATLSIRDTGAGMDAETLTHLFEPFFTTKALGHGTGLGLATVYGIVKQNLGHIAVQSTPGHGTRFTISLPRHDAPAPAAPKRSDTAVPGGAETVLVVEDEETILQLACRILGQHGYKILAAHSPDEALHLATAHHGPIDLMVTDVVMPGLNGKELFSRLATTHPGLRCLFISGYTADVIAHQGVVEDGLRFLGKPFTAAELARKVRRILDERAPPRSAA